MGEAAYAGGIEFTGDNKCGGIGTEVEEQLKMGNQQHTRIVNKLRLTWAMVKQTNFPAVPKCA